MATALSKSPVTRALDTEINGRQVLITIENVDDKPTLRLRLKGYKTGWFLDLNQLSEIASWHPRLKSKDMQLMTTTTKDLKESLESFNWKSKYNGDLI